MRRRFQSTAQRDEHELTPLLEHDGGRNPMYPEQTHPAQGERANSTHTDPGCNSNHGPGRGEASRPKVTHSADLREECRFVLLGGDDFVKYNACNFILRTGQAQQVSDLDDWQVEKNSVLGRHVTVAVSPSLWLESLKSTFFFSRGVEKIKNDMKKCVSEVFPGPHAFLLMIRDGRKPGKAHYLLKAVASVFGKEALDYSMVLFMGGAGVLQSDPTSMKCVKMCGRRHHFLKDTDSSVQELFSKVETMVAKTKNKFFIPSAYAEFMEADFESWEKKRILDMKKLLAKCEDEKDELIKERNKVEDERDKLIKERNKVDEKDKPIKERNKVVHEKDKLSEELNKVVDEKDKLIKEKNKVVDEKDELIKERNKVVDEKDKLIKELNKVVDEKDKLIKERNKVVNEKDELIKERNKVVDEKDKLIKELNKVVDEKDELIKERNKAVDEKDKLSEELREKLHVSEQQNELKTRFIFQQKTNRLLQLESEVTKKDSETKCDNKKQKPQATEERKRRGSKDTFLPNVSPE